MLQKVAKKHQKSIKIAHFLSKKHTFLAIFYYFSFIQTHKKRNKDMNKAAYDRFCKLSGVDKCNMIGNIVCKHVTCQRCNSIAKTDECMLDSTQAEKQFEVLVDVMNDIESYKRELKQEKAVPLKTRLYNWYFGLHNDDVLPPYPVINFVASAIVAIIIFGVLDDYNVFPQWFGVIAMFVLMFTCLPLSLLIAYLRYAIPSIRTKGFKQTVKETAQTAGAILIVVCVLVAIFSATNKVKTTINDIHDAAEFARQNKID